jgi:ribosomal-protein-alanine N-acetyltransferase
MAVLRIRQARLSDVPALARIERDSFVSPWSAEDITRDVAFNEKSYVAVAEINGEPVGYADMWLVAGEAQLYNIVVDPAYRGNEIGFRLMSHMISIASRTCKVINLEVRRSNVPAISLYLKSGFRQVGERKKYYRDNGEDAVLMDRDLSEEDENSEDGNDLEVDIEVK